MELKKTALPIHRDATAKIRPRIFLEGNFFVDLKPGTPDSPALHSGDTIKISQTSTPVQLDQVLTALQSDSREDLKALLDGARHGAELQADGRAGSRLVAAGARADRGRSPSTTPTRTSRAGGALDGSRCSRPCSAPSPGATCRG